MSCDACLLVQQSMKVQAGAAGPAERERERYAQKSSVLCFLGRPTQMGR